VLRTGLKAAGEDIQLPFYGLLLARRAASAAYVSFDRAREGEGGVHAVEPPHSFAELVDSVAARLQSDVQRIADGAPLPAIGVSAVCEHCEMRGLCRRDYWEEFGEDEEDAR
jgi:ATP-dependent helicase/nuclease subunit B